MDIAIWCKNYLAVVFLDLGYALISTRRHFPHLVRMPPHLYKHRDSWQGCRSACGQCTSGLKYESGFLTYKQPN